MVQMNLFAKQNRGADIENKCVDTKWGKERWDELADRD